MDLFSSKHGTCEHSTCFMSKKWSLVKRRLGDGKIKILHRRWAGGRPEVYIYIYCLNRPRGLTFTWFRRCGLCRRQKSTELARSFLFRSRVCFCHYGPFNCISFHKFSLQLSAFSLCSSDLISALLVLSTFYLLMEVSLSPDVILCG